MPPPTECALCGMYVTAYALSRGHINSGVCRAGAARRRQELAQRRAEAALNVRFTAYGTELESVTTFRYLGRPLSCTDSDWPALYWNLKKARKRWAQVSRVLTREDSNPRVLAMFYKAIVMSVLLYGAETWVLTAPMLQALKGFHNRVTRRISRCHPKLQNGEWDVVPIEVAFEIAGMHPLEIYLDRRREYMARFINERPILELCKQQSRLSGSPTRRVFWWDRTQL